MNVPFFVCCIVCTVLCAKGSNDDQVTVGVHFSPEEFLSEAIRLCHPTEHNSLFPKEVRANIAHLSDYRAKQFIK